MEINDYWGLRPKEEIASKLLERFENYQQWLYKSGYGSRIKTCYDRYYGVDQDGTLSIERDETGTKININHFKNLIKRLHILVTQNQLSFQPRSRNSDASSLIDADLGRGILEYYGDSKGMNSVLSEAVETALICLEAYIHSPWDPNSGEPKASDGENFINEGDQAFEVLTAMDVARPINRDADWYILRIKVNKYNLAALYPEYVNEILAADLDVTFHDEVRLDPTLTKYYELDVESDEDTAYAFIMYHDKTLLMPDGRQVLVCGDTVLEDSPLRYDSIPVHRLKAGSAVQTQMADSPGIDLLPLQEAINLLSSAVLTNNVNNAVQNIWSPDPKMTITRISKYQNMITSAQPPQGINFTKSGGETYKLIDQLIANQQLLSGINETTRGNPQASLKSGNSLALMLAQAIQFVSELQKDYAKVVGEVGSCVIDNIKAFAKTERIAYIVGSNKKSYAKIFKREDLYNIDNVIVDLGNPILQSQAGRWELVQMMTQYGLVQDPKLIASFLRTGEIDQATDNEFKDHMLIKQENEMLLRGETPSVVITDIHPEHIMKHKSVFDDPDVRADPNVMENALAHIQEHIDQMRAMDPTLAQMLGMQPLPPEQPPGPPQGDQLPEVNPGGQMEEGVNIPNIPQEAPPQVAQAYNQVIQANQ